MLRAVQQRRSAATTKRKTIRSRTARRSQRATSRYKRKATLSGRVRKVDVARPRAFATGDAPVVCQKLSRRQADGDRRYAPPQSVRHIRRPPKRTWTPSRTATLKPVEPWRLILRAHRRGRGLLFRSAGTGPLLTPTRSSHFGTHDVAALENRDLETIDGVVARPGANR